VGARSCGAIGGATGRRARPPRRSPRASPAARTPAQCCCCTTPTTTPRPVPGARPPPRCRACSRRCSSAVSPPSSREVARAAARGVLHLESTLHIDPEVTLNRWLASHHTLATIASYYYDNAHFVVTLALLGWLWWKRADIYRPLRNSLVLVNALAFVVFWR